MAQQTESASKGIVSTYWGYLRDTFSAWSADNASRLAAALAFWTMLSIAPLLIVCIKITATVYNEEAASGQLQSYLSQTMGSQNASTLREMIASAGQKGSGIFATIFSIALLVWSASNVFVELQNSLNTLWEVQSDPNRGWWKTIMDRAISMALVMSIAFLLLVSLVISTVLSGITSSLGGEQLGWLWQTLDFVIAFAVITALFALMFKYLPDVKVGWRDVAIGAVVTALLFTIGKFALGLYLGRESTTSVYGAAGSIVALLLWVYYSGLILFFGAEFTQVYAKANNRGFEPDRDAVPMTDEARAQQGLVPKRGGKPGAPRPQLKPAWQRYEPKGPGARVVTISRSAPPTGKTIAIAGAGLAAGAALAAVGWFKKRQTHDHASSIQERLAEVQARVNKIDYFKRVSRDLTIAERVDAVRERLREVDAARNGGTGTNGRHRVDELEPIDPVEHPQAAASNVWQHFRDSFQQGRKQSRKPRTVMDRMKDWIGV